MSNVIEVMQQQRSVWAQDIQNGNTRIAALQEEIDRLRRDLIAIDGAVQGCDLLIGRIQSEITVGDLSPTLD